jgi:hypothetical protein
MGGGRGMLTPTSTLPIAIVGVGTAITSAKSTIPKSNFFIFSPLYINIRFSSAFLASHNLDATHDRWWRKGDCNPTFYSVLLPVLFHVFPL